MRGIALAFALLAGPAFAQGGMGPGPGTPHSVTAAYVGPGDLQSWTVWLGLDAYSAAVAAAGTQKIITLRRGSDNVECDFLVPIGGKGVGLSSATCNGSTQGGVTATAFAGTDVTATGSITGTSMTLPAVAHVGDIVTGPGVANGTFIVSGSNPTWLVSIPSTTGSVTLTATWALYAKTLYAQTGAGACDPTQATAGLQPQFLPVGFRNTAPDLILAASQYLFCGTAPTISAPLTMAGVVARDANFAAFSNWCSFGSTPTNDLVLYFNNSANSPSWGHNGVDGLVGAGADSAMHSNIGTGSGSGSTLYIDGASSATGNLSGAGPNTAGIYIGAGWSGGNPIQGSFRECGMIASAISSGSAAALAANQQTRGGY